MIYSLRVSRWFKYIVLAVLGVALYLFIRSLHFHVVLSGSMEPTIRAGSLAITRQVPNSSYVVGDVVLFTNPHKTQERVLHRIIAIQKSPKDIVEVTTKGDANTNGDLLPLAVGAVQGKLLLAVPWLGYVLQILGTTYGFVIAVAFTFLFCVARELQFLFRFLKKHQF